VSKRIKTRGIKSNKAYTVIELAEVAGVSTATVRSWLKAGMPRVDDTRPTLIMGFQALDFIQTRQKKAKRPLAVGQFFCMRCKAQRAAYGAMADHVPASGKGGSLKTLCAVCGGACSRNISAAQLRAFSTVLSICQIAREGAENTDPPHTK
jgi:hypothetical protein